jgi:hypothetical protein
MVFAERAGNRSEDCSWKIETFPDLVLVTKESETELVTSRYNLDGSIQEYHFRYQDGHAELHIKMNNRSIRAVGTRESGVHEKTSILKGNLPWIQQMTIGLKSFFLSPRNKLEFQILNPKDLCLYKLVAEKKRWEAVPGFGNLRRVDVHSDNIIYNLLGLGGTLWFDNQGVLKKMIVNADPREDRIIQEWIRNGP